MFANICVYINIINLKLLLKCLLFILTRMRTVSTGQRSEVRIMMGATNRNCDDNNIN